MKKLMVLYNDTSGNNQGEETANKFKAYAEEQNLNVVLQPSNPDIDPEEIRKNATDNQVDSLIIIGGDGTIHHVIQNFKDTIGDYTIGIIPSGTINNFAKVLNIPVQEQKAFETIVENHVTPVDYGTVNEDVIISTLTVGLLADTAANISQQEKQKYGPLAFMKQFFRLLAKKKKYHLTIKGPNQSWQGKAQLLSMVMTNSAGGFTHFDANATPNDGKAHIILLPKLVFYKFIYYLPKIIRGQLNKIPGVVYLSDEAFKISAKEKGVQTRTDGDPTDDLPVSVKVVKSGLSVCVPENPVGIEKIRGAFASKKEDKQETK
ncbi:diacylglycerol/lipid kinase family protein [Candidatus Enterococcus huntleyi]|uniref:diacylglycerol/lipid kinase family protein n=1 Tax=Candidatus Enterococcus huntleyi TaxID=1857217 RepID=UPI00137A8C2F|nr:diacylglycerol kinase family protein [Enterococcus sp. JM4C]